MTKMKLLSRFFGLFSLVFLACFRQSNTPAITVQELKEISGSNRDVIVIDVRTEPEFIESHLSFTDDLIPYDSLKFHMDRIPIDKDAEIYFFCRSGRRSGIATDYLISQGYSNVYNVTGGIIAWSAADFETVSGNFEK